METHVDSPTGTYMGREEEGPKKEIKAFSQPKKKGRSLFLNTYIIQTSFYSEKLISKYSTLSTFTQTTY